ncbi:MAG: hypothetical protein H6757_01355 [Candidatus Omnitrophica bacterium]|nr:hypothetical protein [Candidatus Omnitrophota bacterium]
MLLMGTMGIGMTHLVSTQSPMSTTDVESREAFYAAEGGLQHIITNEFMLDVDYSDNASPTGAPYGGTPVAIGNAQYWAEYSNQTETSVDIKITAKAGSSVRVVQQTVAMAIPVSYPVFSGGDISLGGNQSCNSNGNHCFPSGMLFGDIAAVGNIVYPDHFTIHGDVMPNQNVTLPEVNLSTYVDELTDTEHTGDLTINGNSGDNVHVTGNVIIQDGANISGNIVADGNIVLSGSIVATGTLAAGGDITGTLSQHSTFSVGFGSNGGVQPILVAVGNIALEAMGLGTVIHGMVITGGEVSITADLDDDDNWGNAIIMNGGIFSGGDLTIYNERGFILINGNEKLVKSLAEGGNLNLQQWHEG